MEHVFVICRFTRLSKSQHTLARFVTLQIDCTHDQCKRLNLSHDVRSYFPRNDACCLCPSSQYRRFVPEHALERRRTVQRRFLQVRLAHHILVHTREISLTPTVWWKTLVCCLFFDVKPLQNDSEAAVRRTQPSGSDAGPYGPDDCNHGHACRQECGGLDWGGQLSGANLNGKTKRHANKKRIFHMLNVMNIYYSRSW